MTNLKDKLELINDYYNSDIFSDAKQRRLEQRRLRDYKEVLDSHRQSSPLVNAACEGKITLTEKVDEVSKLVTDKYKGFWNFWKPYRSLDHDYNQKIESLEEALGYKTKSLKTGGCRAKAIARYVGEELLSYAIGTFGAIATFTCSMMPIMALEKHTSYITPDLIVYGLMGLSLATAGFFKWEFTPPVKNRRARKEDIKELRENAELAQSAIDKIYPKKQEE